LWMIFRSHILALASFTSKSAVLTENAELNYLFVQL